MDIIKSRFGEQLKTIRNLKGFTQEALAEKIGINWRQLARIEAGESFVKSDTLLKICKVLAISPSVLFNFEIQENLLMTGTDNQLHFNVIKTGNLIRLIAKNEIESSSISTANNKTQGESFNNKMLAIAQKLQKNIIVDEQQDGITTTQKIFTPNGEIKIHEKQQNKDNSLERLKDNLSKIANDKKKLEYMNLAFDSLHNKKALEQFQFLIKGLELTLD